MFASVTMVTNSFGLGFREPNQDPEAIARGNAFAATADNPSALYYNPAGITQLEGLQGRAGMYFWSGDAKFSGSSGTGHTDATPQPIPQGFAVLSLDKLPLSFGVGVYAPYGLAIDWGNNNPFRNTAEYGKMLYACANPVVAWRILPGLSVAAGATLNYSQVTLKQGLFTATDQLKFKGDGFDAGFNAGILWQPAPKWSFGVNYRSSTEIDYKGHSETDPSSPFPPYYSRTATHGSIYFPQYIAGGISFRPTPDWNIEFDIDWTDWDKLNTSTLHGSPLGPLPVVFNYQNSFMYELGVTRQLGKGYAFSVGFLYSENSSPDRYFNPIVPDSDLYVPSIGLAYHGSHWEWAACYQLGFNPGRNVSGSIHAGVDGNYKIINNAFALSVGYKF